MRRLWLTTVLLLFMSSSLVQGQSTTFQSGCIDSLQTRIADALSSIDYSAACTEFATCANNAGYEQARTCHMDFMVNLMAQCPADDTHCMTMAQLGAAANAAFSNPLFWYETFDEAPQQLTSIPDALWMAELENYDEALRLYQTEDPYIVYPHPMLPFSMGVIYEAQGNTELALAHYQEALELNTFDPYVLYLRGQLYADMGQTEAAALDIAMLNSIIDTSYSPTLARYIDALSYAEPTFEAWALYPFLSHSYGYTGDDYRDVTGREPRPIRLSFYTDRILADDLIATIGETWGIPSMLVLDEIADDTYHIAYSDFYGGASGVINLLLVDDTFFVEETFGVFESSGGLYSLLAPEGSDNPNTLVGFERCGNGAYHHIGVGDEVIPSMTMDILALYEEPAGISNISRPLEFNNDEFVYTVVGGPECVGDITWWQIENTEGGIYWVPATLEGAFGRYSIIPLDF